MTLVSKAREWWQVRQAIKDPQRLWGYAGKATPTPNTRQARSGAGGRTTALGAAWQVPDSARFPTESEVIPLGEGHPAVKALRQHRHQRTILWPPSPKEVEELKECVEDGPVVRIATLLLSENSKDAMEAA